MKPMSAQSMWLKAASIALGAAALGMNGATVAHHSASMFDLANVTSYDGVVKEFQYTNPHSWLLVDVTGKDGKVTTWGFEAEGPSTLTRAGIRKSDFAPGTKLTISGHAMRDGRPAALWVKAVRADGKQFDPRAGFKIN